MAEIAPADWNRLAGKANPFLCHEFLLALETTGCTTPDTGWEPSHLVISAEDGQLIAAMPLYIKSNSFGEYVFDWSWADAYHGHGLPYYPKLVTAIPFTPSTGPRLLLDETIAGAASEKSESMQKAIASIIQIVIEFARDNGMSSWHLLFPTEEESALFSAAGLLRRTGCQFHWFNRGYSSFEDFLGSFSSRKRKNLRKEREAVVAQGISFEHYNGGEADETLWNLFYEFYQNTYQVRGREGYLTRSFFRELARQMPERILLVIARKNGRAIAGAMSLRDSHTLYGRYWGCRKEFQFLHFETCYYQGIDYCIANGLQRFDSGAQGEHKIQRGFEPVKTYSHHWIADKRFADAIADFVNREQVYIDNYQTQAARLLPFRQTSS